MSIQDGATLGDLACFADLLSVDDLARKLKVHPDTIRRWERRGWIKSIRHPISNYRLFRLSDLLGEGKVGKYEGKSRNIRKGIVEGAGT